MRWNHILPVQIKKKRMMREPKKIGGARLYEWAHSNLQEHRGRFAGGDRAQSFGPSSFSSQLWCRGRDIAWTSRGWMKKTVDEGLFSFAEKLTYMVREGQESSCNLPLTNELGQMYFFFTKQCIAGCYKKLKSEDNSWHYWMVHTCGMWRNIADSGWSASQILTRFWFWKCRSGTPKPLPDAFFFQLILFTRSFRFTFWEEMKQNSISTTALEISNLISSPHVNMEFDGADQTFVHLFLKKKRIGLCGTY